MNNTQAALIAFICACATLLIWSGKVAVPIETVHELGALIVGVVGGWLGLSKPGDKAQMER